MLGANPELKPTTLLLYLQEKYPEEYQQSHLRTLQRRVKQWKANCGPPKEVYSERLNTGFFEISQSGIMQQYSTEAECRDMIQIEFSEEEIQRLNSGLLC